MPFSRASWIIRLIGADSGLTMAMIRLAATMLPNPILASLILKSSVPPTGLPKLLHQRLYLALAKTLHPPILVDTDFLHDASTSYFTNLGQGLQEI